jgi:Tfp pilus assembly protein PilF
MNEWLVLLSVFLSVFISGVLVIVLHETGHAFAYLILTRPEKIDLYIGSHGDQGKYFKLKAGKLTYLFKKPILTIKGKGICVSSKYEKDYRRRIIILLAGVVFTLVVALVFWAVIVIIDSALPLQIFAYIFLGLSVIGFIFNLIPARYQGIRMYTKEYDRVNTDGRQILFAIKARKVYAEYMTAYEYIRENQPEQAIEQLKLVLAHVPNAEDVIRALSNQLLLLKKYAGAEPYLQKLEQLNKAHPQDVLNLATVKSKLHKHDEAIAGYQKVLKADRQNAIALNNLGYEMVKKGAHKVAAQILQKAIKLKPGFVYPYCNLAYSQFLQNDLGEGKQYLYKALQINNKSAYVHVVQAIYYLRMNKREEADASIAHALDIDPAIELNDYNEELEKYTENTSA